MSAHERRKKILLANSISPDVCFSHVELSRKRNKIEIFARVDDVTLDCDVTLDENIAKFTKTKAINTASCKNKQETLMEAEA